VLLAAQWLRARRGRPPLRATGPAGHALNAAVFLALYLTPFYAPALSVTSDAALIFCGASMLLAAARGYRGSRCSPSPTGCCAVATKSAACCSRRSTTPNATQCTPMTEPAVTQLPIALQNGAGRVVTATETVRMTLRPGGCRGSRREAAGQFARG
jgi:hypothetical protein